MKLSTLFFLATTPVLAAPGQPFVNRATLPSCPKPINYLRAVEIEKQAVVEMNAARWPEANRLITRALATLGTGYNPYHRTVDNTAQYLEAAGYMERGGNLARAAREKKFVLDNRLGMQVEPMLCNENTTHIQW